MSGVLATAFRYLLGLFVLLLVLVAVLASIGRYWIPYLGDYQSSVLSWVNERTPFEIAATSMNGDWQRLSPSIDVRELRLGDGPDALHIDRAFLKLNLLKSAWHRKLVFDQLQFSGLDLELQEGQNGDWQLVASWLPRQSPNAGLISLESLYEGLDQLLINAAKITLLRNAGNTIVVDHLNIDYRKRGQRWQIRSSALPDRSPLPINVIAEGVGLPMHANFAARGYSKLDAFDVSPYVSNLNYQGWQVQLPRFDGELWFDHHAKGTTQLQGKVDLHQIAFVHGEEQRTIDVPELKSQFKFSLTEDLTPSVWLRNLHVRLQEEDISFQHANLVPTDDGLVASFDSIHINPVLRLLRRFEIMPENAQRILTELDPAGEFQNISLHLPRENTLRDMTVAADLQGFAISAWKGAPAVRNGTGRLNAGLRSGTVELRSNNVSLGFPSLFNEPMQFASLAGPVRWQIHERIVEVESGELSVTDAVGRAKAYLHLSLPIKKEYELTPLMELQVGLLDSHARHRHAFIPNKLNQGLQNWLKSSILSADINEAAFIYRGSLKKQADKERSIQLYLDVEEAELDYQADWPVAQGLAAQIYVDDANVAVEIGKGRVSDLQLDEATLSYSPRPNSKGGVITLNSALRGEIADGLDFLLDSPIARGLGKTLADWRAEGTLRGQLKASIPIGLDRKEKIDFRARLHDGLLANDGLRLEFADINGPIRYTDSRGLFSDGLVGTLWSDSLSATISSTRLPAAEDGRETGWATDLKVSGASRSDGWLDWLQVPLHEYLQGEFRYEANLQVRGRETELLVLSDLQGLQSELPIPFQKAGQQPLPLNINLFLNERPVRLRLSLADRLRAALNIAADAPLTGTLVFGESVAAEYATDSLRLQGNIEEFDLHAFLDVIDTVSRSRPTEPLAAGNPSSAMNVYAQSLMLEKVHALGNEFNNVNAAIASHGTAWTFAFDGQSVAGRATYDSSQLQPLDLSLDRLYLAVGTVPGASDSATLSGSDSSGAAEPKPLDNVYPADLPEMQFKLNDLRIDGNEFGRWSFNTARAPHGMTFHDLDVNTRGLQIAGTPDRAAALEWRRVGDQQETLFSGVLSCADLGGVLEAWGYAPAIRSKNCRFDTDLSWYGSPLDLELKRMEGQVAILLNNGQFLETNSTANALRLFSLFNFDTLLRRLQFRFDDVFNRGLSYDQITGQFSLANGRLNIVEPFDVQGSSSRLQMTGSLDLVNETVDTRMIATLPISSNLPWVAALVGGLPMAGAVYVAGKIFQKPMEKLSSASYAVTGSWDEPSIKLQQVFDDKAEKAGQSSPLPGQPSIPDPGSTGSPVQ